MNKDNNYKLYYLASPYSFPDGETEESRELAKQMRNERYLKAEEAAVKLLTKSVYSFSPIAYNHQMHLRYSLPTDWGFWKPYDISFLERCSGVIVLMLEGWENSIGIKAEVEYALEHNIPVEYVKLEDL